MLFGAHVSMAGGLDKAPLNAQVIGCECFQMFARSPRGGQPPRLAQAVIKSFQSAMKQNQQAEAYIHAPYYINLASANNRIRFGSIKVIREELDRATSLGVKYVMTHLGSANDLPRDQAINQVILGIKKVLDGYQGSAWFLIENSAGSGNIIGNRFEEIAQIIKGLPRALQNKTAVCLDTCHAFASGYDLRSKQLVNQTIKEFAQVIGLPKLKLIHANDSKTDLGSKVDRHEHIGLGKIGLEGFKALIHHPKLQKINMILETPVDDQGDQPGDLKVLKKLRGK